MTLKGKRNLGITIKIIEALLLITTGVFAIIYSGDTSLQSVIIILIGVFLIFDGCTKILGYYMNPVAAQRKNLITSVFELTIGIIFCVRAAALVSLINEIITWFIAILLIVIAILFLLSGFMEFKRIKKNNGMIITEYIIGIIFFVAGVLMIIFQGRANFITFTIIVAGALFIVAGITQIVLLFNKR
jgi:uncharacterized membrane protein HdeD (DUF308 family)